MCLVCDLCKLLAGQTAPLTMTASAYCIGCRVNIGFVILNLIEKRHIGALTWEVKMAMMMMMINTESKGKVSSPVLQCFLITWPLTDQPHFSFPPAYCCHLIWHSSAWHRQSLCIESCRQYECNVDHMPCQSSGFWVALQVEKTSRICSVATKEQVGSVCPARRCSSLHTAEAHDCSLRHA